MRRDTPRRRRNAVKQWARAHGHVLGPFRSNGNTVAFCILCGWAFHQSGIGHTREGASSKAFYLFGQQ